MLYAPAKWNTANVIEPARRAAQPYIDGPEGRRAAAASPPPSFDRDRDSQPWLKLLADDMVTKADSAALR